MSSITAPTPDTLITLKINIEGSNRRFKLPLRDLSSNALPDKVCDNLQLIYKQGCTILQSYPYTIMIHHDGFSCFFEQMTNYCHLHSFVIF